MPKTENKRAYRNYEPLKIVFLAFALVAVGWPAASAIAKSPTKQVIYDQYELTWKGQRPTSIFLSAKNCKEEHCFWQSGADVTIFREEASNCLKSGNTPIAIEKCTKKFEIGSGHGGYEFVLPANYRDRPRVVVKYTLKNAAGGYSIDLISSNPNHGNPSGTLGFFGCNKSICVRPETIPISFGLVEKSNLDLKLFSPQRFRGHENINAVARLPIMLSHNNSEAFEGRSVESLVSVDRHTHLYPASMVTRSLLLIEVIHAEGKISQYMEVEANNGVEYAYIGIPCNWSNKSPITFNVDVLVPLPSTIEKTITATVDEFCG